MRQVNCIASFFHRLNPLAKITASVWLSVFCAVAISSRAETVVMPDERDGQVLEALLLHLLCDPKFDMTRVSTNEEVIVLHNRTPEKTGFLQSHQMRADTRDHRWPSETELDLRRRNSPANAKTDTYDSVKAYYTNLTFDARIVVTDLSKISSARRSFRALQEAYPHARGFVTLYLPGYSKDGNQALVRAGVEPSAHGAMLTALLEKQNKKWIVKWFHIARFA